MNNTQNLKKNIKNKQYTNGRILVTKKLSTKVTVCATC